MKKLINWFNYYDNKLMKLSLLSIVILLNSCASFEDMSAKNKTYTLAAVGAVVGILAGQNIGSTAETKKNLTYMGTGLGASTGFMVGMNLYDFEEKPLHSEQEFQALSLKVQEFEKQMNLELISKGTTESEKTPPELREYLKKGKWERYKLQRWNQDPEDENIFYKITEQIKLIPKEGEE